MNNVIEPKFLEIWVIIGAIGDDETTYGDQVGPIGEVEPNYRDDSVEESDWE